MRRIVLLCAIALATAACASDTPGSSPAPEAGGTLTLYSGRGEELVGPLVEAFESETGIDVEVRYGDTAELAAAIAEEGDRSPADVFWAQDGGALGAVAGEGGLTELPDDVLDAVDPGFRAADGVWVGTSGRARVLVYNTDLVDDPPASVFDLTGERWKGKIGWAPTNGSFQAFVTAMRVVEGEDTTTSWLGDMDANDTQVYASNTPIVHAVAAGEIEAGLVNHYYLFNLSKEDPSIAETAANHFFDQGDIGNLVNVAGVGVLGSTDDTESALRFVRFLLSPSSAQYFAEETSEYPLAADAEPDERLPALDDIGAPEIDLSDLVDLRGTLELLRSTGVL